MVLLTANGACKPLLSKLFTNGAVMSEKGVLKYNRLPSSDTVSKVYVPGAGMLIYPCQRKACIEFIIQTGSCSGKSNRIAISDSLPTASTALTAIV